MNVRQLAGVGLSLLVALGPYVPAFAASPAKAQTLVIGVDHLDLANQQPNQGRVFEYTDFFSREVTVHTGDTLDFRAAPGSFHIVALAKDEAVARQVYPVAFADTEDPIRATGTGLPKIGLGPSNLSITGGSTSGGGAIANNPNGPPVCGVPTLGEAPCTFSGGNDIEVAGPNPALDAQGQPIPVDWKILINAAPGEYDFFCFIHPGMRGKLTVVGANSGTTTQAQIDFASQLQFLIDRAEGLAVEAAANFVRFSGGLPGQRTYFVSVGVGTSDRHVAVDEILPRQPLNLVAGDQVRYEWRDPHNVHSVTFPANDPNLPAPFGFDCGKTYSSTAPCVDPTEGSPEFIADPGTLASGGKLTNPSQHADAGVLIGTGYNVTPTAQTWTAILSGPGSYKYQCVVHDWMQGTLNVH